MLSALAHIILYNLHNYEIGIIYPPLTNEEISGLEKHSDWPKVIHLVVKWSGFHLRFDLMPNPILPTILYPSTFYKPRYWNLSGNVSYRLTANVYWVCSISFGSYAEVSYSLGTQLPKVWFIDQQNWHLLGACWKCKISGPRPL